jgi:hypothetical protein
VSLVDNERIKLLANAFDRASTACFTVGIATPLAGYIYNVSGFRGTIGYGTMAASLAGWFAVAVGLHMFASRLLTRLQP